MKILEYVGLDTNRVKSSYLKVRQLLEKGDFQAAQVKKLTNLTHGKFYRAKLDESNRLLFSLVRYNDNICVLMLEIILNHDYANSRFLRGCEIDENKIPDIQLKDALNETQSDSPLRYLHPERTAIHILDKAISFDEAQETIYRQPSPLIVVGSAGSGKTALILEKLKHAQGEVLYVTHSSFLAQSARDLYYANGFEAEHQEALFLSYREFIESIEIPKGREATWRDFSIWFNRQIERTKGIDAHQAFEEIRGVITANSGGVLTRTAYQNLGVRQSIFQNKERDLVYDLFEKYRVWLTESRLYDLNLIAHDWQPKADARFDFLVIDEVQDITTAQLSLLLKTLKKAGHFMLCGDSNQIVHPNFFSWSQVKTLFWKDPDLAQQQSLSILTANFRNGLEATRVANQLLKIKQRRFGSVDRESNFLVQAVGAEKGQVALMPDKEASKRELDLKIRQSTQFAVLVMRDEDKIEARKYFSTPLLFSIHEAKGLEYENIVLYRFVSDNRNEFNDITEGVNLADLQIDTLEYRRAKDKNDKSLEIYKFYVNALYVALTRAIKNLYLIESDIKHALFDLLDLQDNASVQVQTQKSSLEDWQKEARKLELQGKQEQADAIRSNILKQIPVPWQVLDDNKFQELTQKVFIEKIVGNKPKQQLIEYACVFYDPILAQDLEHKTQFQQANNYLNRDHLAKKTRANFEGKYHADIFRQCEKYGLEHRLPMNITPLMAAAAAGNVALVEALLERGANKESVDHYGFNALHWVLREAQHQEKVNNNLAALYELLAPASIDINNGSRLIRLDKHQSEYLMFQTFWVLFKSCFTHSAFKFNDLDLKQSDSNQKSNEIYTAYNNSLGALDSERILQTWLYWSSNIVKPERNKRTFVNAVLSRNEVERDYKYNRALFKRQRTGLYQFNPALLIRNNNCFHHVKNLNQNNVDKNTNETIQNNDQNSWIPIYNALNLPLIAQSRFRDVYALRYPPMRLSTINKYLEEAKLPWIEKILFDDDE